MCMNMTLCSHRHVCIDQPTMSSLATFANSQIPREPTRLMPRRPTLQAFLSTFISVPPRLAHKALNRARGVGRPPHRAERALRPARPRVRPRNARRTHCRRGVVEISIPSSTSCALCAGLPHPRVSTRRAIFARRHRIRIRVSSARHTVHADCRSLARVLPRHARCALTGSDDSSRLSSQAQHADRSTFVWRVGSHSARLAHHRASRVRVEAGLAHKALNRARGVGRPPHRAERALRPARPRVRPRNARRTHCRRGVVEIGIPSSTSCALCAGLLRVGARQTLHACCRWVVVGVGFTRWTGETTHRRAMMSRGAVTPDR